MKNKLLPIGSIVLTKRSNEYKFMIIGYFPVKSAKECKDYIAVRYPMGAYNSHIFFSFDHSEIIETVFKGYEDDDFKAMRAMIDQDLH